MQSVFRIAILTAVVAAASACSGGHGDSQQPPAKRNSAFIARAEHVCSRARAQLDALPAFPFRQFDALHPDARLLPKVGRFFTGKGNELPIVRRLDAELRGLGTPPADHAAWASVLETLRNYIAVFHQEDAAALRADARAWVSAVRLNRQLHTRLATTTTSFGARRCDVL